MSRRRSLWQTVAREPLVHFVAIGAVLFVIDAWRRSPGQTAGAADLDPVAAAAPPRAPIVVDGRARSLIRQRAQRRHGRVPTAAELAAETDGWIDEEILYREAVERGLDRDDPTIHQRVASRMSYLLEQAVVVPEPDEAELRAWFDDHRQRWTVPERIDFTHVFIAGDDAAARARLDRVAAALQAGASPGRLGDRFTGGHRYRGRQLADLSRTFGEAFAADLDHQAPGGWHRRRSRYGLHLVRVDRVQPARAAEFASARLDVRKAWRDARLDAGVEAELRRIRAGWEIVRP